MSKKDGNFLFYHDMKERAELYQIPAYLYDAFLTTLSKFSAKYLTLREFKPAIEMRPFSVI